MERKRNRREEEVVEVEVEVVGPDDEARSGANIGEDQLQQLARKLLETIHHKRAAIDIDTTRR